MRTRATAALVILAVLAGIAAVVAVLRPGTVDAVDAPDEPGTIRHEPQQDDRVRLVVIGDSISQGDSPAFAHGKFGKASWPFYIDTDVYRFIGGTVKGGNSSEEALTDVEDDLRGDVVVYALGTNDLRMGQTSPEEFMDNIAEHHERSTGSQGAEVVVLAVGPMKNMRAEITRTWNSGVRTQAQQHGFTYLDPWTTLRTSDYRWRDAADTPDGIHPSERGSKKLGEAISELVASEVLDTTR